MGAECCKSSGANNDGERNMLSRDPAENEMNLNEDSSESENFVLKVDGEQFFSLMGNAKKKPGKFVFSTEKFIFIRILLEYFNRDAYAALNEVKPLKNITIQTLYSFHANLKLWL